MNLRKIQAFQESHVLLSAIWKNYWKEHKYSYMTGMNHSHACPFLLELAKKPTRFCDRLQFLSIHKFHEFSWNTCGHSPYNRIAAFIVRAVRKLPWLTVSVAHKMTSTKGAQEKELRTFRKWPICQNGLNHMHISQTQLAPQSRFYPTHGGIRVKPTCGEAVLTEWPVELEIKSRKIVYCKGNCIFMHFVPDRPRLVPGSLD